MNTATFDIRNLSIDGPSKSVPLRLYQPRRGNRLPIILYFHGGGFTGGDLNNADIPAGFLANHSHALVVSVGYSLAPAFPFPAALEDGYLAAKWAVKQAAAYRADGACIGVAGDDAGGSIAAGLAMLARDRGEFRFAAQALIAPLLDPSMTRLGDERKLASDVDSKHCAECYRAYLPTIGQRMHPYAAPLESKRLAGLPPLLIASAEHDILHVEAERYAAALIEAGVHTEVTRHGNVSHHELAAHAPALRDVSNFFDRRLVLGAT